MSSSDYSYDAEGQFFPFFMLTMVGLVTVPLTYNVLKPSTELEQTAAHIESDFKPKDEDLIQAQKKRQRRKERKLKRIVAVIFGWISMAYLAYLVYNSEQTRIKLWDPYDILGVSRSLSEREIDKFYRRLSIVYHPDKVKPDPNKNETVESINDRWVEMTKAYKALTDEDIRNNYLMYGNPDGKMSTSIGIALPKWMVEEGNRWIVVGFYGVLLGVLLPWTLGSWWYGTQSRTKEGVVHKSAGNLFKEWKEDVDEIDILGAVSVGEEYKEIVKSDAGAAKVEKLVMLSDVPEEAKKKIRSEDDPVKRKSLCLLWAYLARIDLGDAELEKEKYSIPPVAFLLNNSFTSITLPFQLLSPLVASYHAQQHLIQATTPKSSPALQLPNFSPEVVQKLSGTSSKSPLTIQKLMALPPSVRRSLCSALTDSQYKSAMKTASSIPNLQVAKAFFKVIGDRVVTPSSLVQLVVKARVIPSGTPSSSIPAINIADLEDKDPDEGDIEALKGRTKGNDGKLKDTTYQPPLAHAPYYAADHAPRWHVFLADSRQGRIAVPPFTFTAFDKPAFTPEGKPTFNILTFRCQFQAPPQVAQFPFTMYLICDSYVGFDSKVDIALDVRDVGEADVVESDDDISEPEEDSLAGQLQQMKTGQAPKPKRKMKKIEQIKKVEESDSEDESDTDGEAASDTSETDTETEDED